jgi:arsenate reductase-like glutaredoxin family protein
LRKAGHELEEINLAKAPLTEAMVKDLVTRAGSVAAVLNTRHAIAKAKGWADKPPDAAAFAKAAVKDVNLLRRPLLVVGRKLVIGFDKAAYAKLT